MLLLKTFGISVINYEIRMKGINNKQVKELKTIFHDFLWDKKHPLVNRDTIALPVTEGGLQMINIENCIKIAQIKLINNLIRGDDETWTILPKFWFSQVCPKINNEMFITICSDIKDLNLTKIPTFYREALITWASLRGNRTIANISEILNENLFCNENIKSHNKTLLFVNWQNSGISKIQHIWDTDNNTWAEENTILEKLTDTNNWMAEYFSLKNAVPKIWKETLKSKQYESNEKQLSI